MKQKRGARRDVKDRGVSIPVSVTKKGIPLRQKHFGGQVGHGALGVGDYKAPVSDLPSPISIFANHRHVNALAPIFAARPKVFKDSMMREIVPVHRSEVSKIQFSSIPEIKKSLGEHLCRSCMEDGDYGVPESVHQNFPKEVVDLAIPKIWIRSASRLASDRNCPATSSLSHLSISPRMQIHGLRHAYAHAGGWSALEPEDRLRVAHAIQQRLISPDRIRFAHIERITNHAEHLYEYWAELLAFALSIEAQQESEWRRSFLSRAVQRGAGATLAYPMPETGEKDLQLVRWYFDHVDIHEPWIYATQANEWTQRSEKEDRSLRIRNAISGFPPGNMRMIYSIFIETDPIATDVAHRLSRLDSNIPDHLATWVEQACLFADHVGSLDANSNEASLLSESALLAAGLERFSEVDQQKALKAVQQYIHQKVNAL